MEYLDIPLGDIMFDRRICFQWIPFVYAKGKILSLDDKVKNVLPIPDIPSSSPSSNSGNKIPDGPITTSKLADGAVTNPKLASDAVTSDKMNA